MREIESMTYIAIPYFTGSGHTKKLAELVVEGIQSVSNVEVEFMDVEDLKNVPWENLHKADAIIFASPTYMGSVAGPFKSFMDETGNFWIEQKWADKIAAGITVGTSASGDKLNSLVQMSVFAAQHGMIWVGQNHVGSKHTNDGQKINEAGAWLGLVAQSDKDKSKLIVDHDIQTARNFGERVAKATVRWQRHEKRENNNQAGKNRRCSGNGGSA